MSSDETLASRLETLLEEEYRILLEGNLRKIEEYGESKLALLELVEALPVEDIAEFSHLRQKLVRNQILTQSAIKGMKLAIDRATECLSVATQLKTYEASGKPKQVGLNQGKSLSRRT